MTQSSSNKHSPISLVDLVENVIYQDWPNAITQSKNDSGGYPMTQRINVDSSGTHYYIANGNGHDAGNTVTTPIYLTKMGKHNNGYPTAWVAQNSMIAHSSSTPLTRPARLKATHDGAGTPSASAAGENGCTLKNASSSTSPGATYATSYFKVTNNAPKIYMSWWQNTLSGDSGSTTSLVKYECYGYKSGYLSGSSIEIFTSGFDANRNRTILKSGSFNNTYPYIVPVLAAYTNKAGTAHWTIKRWRCYASA